MTIIIKIEKTNANFFFLKIIRDQYEPTQILKQKKKKN